MRRLSFAEEIEPEDSSNALNCIHKMHGSNIHQVIGYSNGEISWFSLFSPSRFSNSTPIRLQLLPNHFHFTSHLTIQCSMVWVQTTLESKQPRNQLEF